MRYSLGHGKFLSGIPLLDGEKDTRDNSRHEKDDDRRSGRQRRPMLPNEFFEAVKPAGRSDSDRLVAQVMGHFVGELGRGFVPARRLFFQRFHDDPIQLAMNDLPQAVGFLVSMLGDVGQFLGRHRLQLRRRPRRFILANPTSDLVDCRAA